MCTVCMCHCIVGGLPLGVHARLCVCVCVAGGGGLTSSFLSSALSIVLSLVGAATSIFDNVFVHFC